MTMFFTTDASFHITNVKEAIQAYPDWKLYMKKGDDIIFMPKVQSCDPDYLEYWIRVQNNRDHTMYKSLDDGLVKIRNGQSIIYTTTNRFNFYMNTETKFESLEFFIISTNSPMEMGNLALRKNCPISELVGSHSVSSMTKA